MKIGIDTFACNGGNSGIGIYTMQLLKRIPPSDARFELFGWEFDRFAFSEVVPNMEFIPKCRYTGKFANSLWHIFKYPEFAVKRAYNACFFPAAHKMLPLDSPCPSIGVVHDMAPWRKARASGRYSQSFVRAVLPNALRKLGRIIAVSQWVKQELIEIAGIKESLIEVVPNGIDTEAFHPRPRNEESLVLIQPFSFRRPYILYASRIEHPMKNHVRLIKAFNIFRERTKFPHRLVLAGMENHDTKKVREIAAASPYRSDIFFTGQFPQKSLPELYAGADIVVIPSLYEGFGMGVLEAMASGVPVTCARAASLPETAEHAALYFDPTDVEDMADRMVTLTSKRDVYHECRRLGLERAQLFSWDHCAGKTLQIIHETVGW
ncbi:MAG: glycosyltransferase family 4 protein [Treponema sp.]|nr:glycosyltransferase family 4 protein [Treponema sp.]